MTAVKDHQPGDTISIQGALYRITKCEAAGPFRLTPQPIPLPTPLSSRRCDTPRCPNQAPDTGVQIGPGAYLHLCDNCIHEMLPPELQPERVQ